jgi:cytochrome c biogenesis protein
LAVHVALLTIFGGGFLTAQFGRDGMMPLSLGEAKAEVNQFSFDWTTPSEPKIVQVSLPFQVECTDLQQKLIQLNGPITSDNTIDWSTNVKITDEYGSHSAVVSLNKPYDYRGYRFFQASFAPEHGEARSVTLTLTPQDGGQPVTVTIPRAGSTTLGDGTHIEFKDFQPDFTMNGSEAASRSGEYNNPAAVLQVTAPTGEAKRAFAFQQVLPAGAPVGAPVLGYKFHLASFEKVSGQHTLAINKDPGKPFVYIGFFGLIGTLCAVFFFSHQRVWISIEPKAGETVTLGPEQFDIVIGGNTNRNKLGFEDRVNKLGSAITGENQEVIS